MNRQVLVLRFEGTYVRKSYIVETGRMRRKGVGTTAVKSWMVVSETGHSRLEDVGKHSIMRRTGLPARDPRVLDPVLSYPSSILGRERAIVVNFEHVKAIITASELLLINSSNPFFLSFLQDLHIRLSNLNPSSVRTSLFPSSFFFILKCYSFNFVRNVSLENSNSPLLSSLFFFYVKLIRFCVSPQRKKMFD